MEVPFAKPYLRGDEGQAVADVIATGWVSQGPRVREIIDGMIANGVFVRDRTKDPATPTCFRLTTGVVEHTRKACDTLEALCGKR